MSRLEEEQPSKQTIVDVEQKYGPLYYPGTSGMFPIISGLDGTEELGVERVISWVVQKLRRLSSYDSDQQEAKR